MDIVERKETLEFVREWMMSGDHEPTQWERDFAAAIDARAVRAIDTDTLAERFCVTPLPDSVCADLCATTQGPGRYGTHLMTVAEAKTVLDAALTPPLPLVGE